MGKPMVFSIHKYCQCVEQQKANAEAAKTKYKNRLSQRIRLSEIVRSGHYATVSLQTVPPSNLVMTNRFVPSF